MRGCRTHILNNHNRVDYNEFMLRHYARRRLAASGSARTVRLGKSA